VAWNRFARLFAKLLRTGDSEVTFAVFESSYKKKWIASGYYITRQRLSRKIIYSNISKKIAQFLKQAKKDYKNPF